MGGREEGREGRKEGGKEGRREGGKEGRRGCSQGKERKGGMGE